MIARLAAALLGVWVIVLTLWPFQPVRGMAEWRGRLTSLATVDWPVLLHLAAATAVGVAAATGWRRLANARGVARFGAVLTVAIALEAAQSLVVGRHASLADVAAHVLGAMVGLSLARRLAGRFGAGRRGAGLALGAALLGCVGTCVAGAVIEYRLTGFHGWDDEAVLVFGNEATGDRPWRGTIHGVAIYREALEEQQVRYLVRERFRTPAASADRLKRQAVAVYAPLNAYQLTSQTGLRWMGSGPLGDGLDLFVEAGQPVRADAHGVTFDGGVLATREPAAPLTDLIRRRRVFSLEAYVTPSTLVQVGPARIVSLSRTPGKRNFTLGQEGSAIHFRLRTPVSGPNGDDHDADAIWPGVFTDAEPKHLVVTHRHGELRLYVNGEPHGAPWRMQALHRWAANVPWAAPAATMALAASLLLLPVGLVGPALWDRARRPRRAVAAWVVLAAMASAAFHLAVGPTGGWFATAAVAAGVLLAVRAHPGRA